MAKKSPNLRSERVWAFAASRSGIPGASPDTIRSDPGRYPIRVFVYQSSSGRTSISLIISGSGAHVGVMDPGVAVGSGVTGLGVAAGVTAGLIVYGAGVAVGLGVGVDVDVGLGVAGLGVGVGVGLGVVGLGVGVGVGLGVVGLGVGVGVDVGLGVGVGVDVGVPGVGAGFAIVVIFAGFSVADAISSLCFMYLK